MRTRPAAQVTQVLDGALGFFGQTQQALGVVAQQAAGFGQRRVLGGAVEQPSRRRSPRAGGRPG